MASLYRRITTRRLPDSGKLTGPKRKDGSAPAKWTDSRGTGHTCDVKQAADGSWRILTTYFFCNYRDPTGKTVVVSTGCADKVAAEAVMARLVRESELVKAGILTVSESKSIQSKSSAKKHVQEYLERQSARGLSSQHLGNQSRALNRFLTDCKPNALNDITRDKLERWVYSLKKSGMGHRNINVHRSAVVAFMHWANRARLIATTNQVELATPLQESADTRKIRRALTVEEVNRLCHAAETSGHPEGLHRAMFYRLAAWTGLRRNEVRAMKVRDFDLDGLTFSLPGRHEKSGKGAFLPLHPDLASVLRGWITANNLGLSDPVVRIGNNLLRSFKADCVRAGIKLVDDQGRSIDIHALRHTFITWLAAAGVPMRVAQHLARHSRIELTASRYTDPSHLPAKEGLALLPRVTTDSALEVTKTTTAKKRS